jgi:carbon monoxide dehydrogenase subunit G
MEFRKQITINKSADDVWKIVGTDFNEVSDWSSFVITSNGDNPPAVGEARVCDVNGMGQVVETIYHFDADKRELAFTLEGSRNPFFMKRIENEWNVRSQSDGQSTVDLGVNIDLMTPFKQLMSGRLKKMMGKRADFLLNELKQHAESE